MAEDTQEPLTQDPPSKASKLYNNLLSDGYTPKNLGSEEEFTSALSDPSKAAKIYNGLLGDGYTVKNLGGMDDFLNTFTKNTVSQRPSSYPIKPAGFAANINMGEAQKQLPINLHPEQEQTQQQQQAPSIENNFGFNQTAEKNVADNTANVAPQQALEKVDFDVNHVQRVKQQEQYTNQAIDNATAKALKLKGINAQPGSVQYNQQRNEFVKQVQNGDATVNTKGGEAGLERTTGFLENIKNGWNEATTGADEADDFANKMTAQERVDYLNKKQSEQKPSPYIGEKPNLLGSTGHLVGSSVPFLGKAAAGAVIGAGAVAAAPESMGASLAGLPTAMSFMLTAPDMVNQGVQQEVSRRYQILKHEHPERSDVENMEEAGKGALVGGVGGILENAALMGTGMNTPILSESKSLIGQTVNKIINSGVHLGTVSAGITAAEQEIGNLQGIKTSQSDILKNSLESFKEGATTGAALTALMHVPQMPKILKSAFKDAIVRNENPQTVANVLQANENVGNIPQGTTQAVTADLNGYREALGKMPDGLSTEAQSSIAGLIQKKNNLIEEAKTKDDSFKDFYKQKTDAIDQQISDIQRTGKPFEHEIDEATGKPYEPPTYDEVAQQRVQELAKKISKNADISDPQSIQTQQNFPEQLKAELQNIADVEKKNNEGKENPNTEVADNAENYIKKNLTVNEQKNDNPIQNDVKPAPDNVSRETGVLNNEPKLAVEPPKPITEMNSEEMYDYATQVKKELRRQDKEFENKTEAEKEAGGYYDVIDNVEDLRDASTKINYIENAEGLDDLASSVRAAVSNIRNKPTEYDLAILNAAKKKAAELNIPTEDLIKEVVKQEGNRHRDANDAAFMMKNVLEKLIQGEPNTGTPPEINKPLPENEVKPEEQGNKGNVPESVEPVGQGGTEGAASVLETENQPKTSSTEKTRQEKINDLVDRIHILDKQPKNAKGRINEINEIKLQANELGLTYDDKRVAGLFNKNGNKVRKKTGGNNAIIEDYVPLSKRDENTKGFVGTIVEAANRDGVDSSDYFPTVKDADGRRMTKSQIKKAISDVQNDKPTAGAQALLDAVDDFHKRGDVDVSTPTVPQTGAITPEEYLANFKEPISKEGIQEIQDKVGEKQFDEIYEELKNQINETGTSNAGDQPNAGETGSGNAPEAGNGIKRIKEAEEGLARAKSDHDRATADLSKAEKKLSEKQSKQGDLLNPEKNIVQQDAFANDANVVKDALEPLRTKVKETKDAFDKAKTELENANKGIQPELKLNKSEERVFKDQIKKSDADKIIEDEGLTADNINNYKHLFNGFPYTPEDFKNIKNSFNEKRPTPEPAADGQEDTGGAGDKKTGDEIKAAETPDAKGTADKSSGSPEGGSSNAQMEKVGKFEAWARGKAAKLDEAPDWLFGSNDNVKSAGIDGQTLKKALQESLIGVGKLLDAGVEIGEAIKKAADGFIKKLEELHGVNKLDDKYEQQVRKGFEGEAKKNFAKFEESNDMIGVRHERTNAIADEFGFEGYKKNPETIAEWDRQAEEKIRNGYDIDKLIDKLEHDYQPDKIEQRIMAKYIGVLKDKVGKDPSDANLTELKKVIGLSDIVGGREVAKSLVARRGTQPVDNTLADYFIRKMEANQVDKLTDAQKEQVRVDYENIKSANEALEAKIKSLEEENARIKAGENISDIRRRTRVRRSDADFASERKQIIQSIHEKLRKARSEMNVTPIPYAKELAVIAPDVAKIVKNLVEQGVTKLADVVDNIHDVLKDEINGITKKDVQDLIAGKYNEPKKTKNEIAAAVNNLKREAKLLGELESLEKGETPVKESKKIERNRRIAELKKQVDEHDLSQIEQKKSSLKKQIEDLEHQLKTGDFSKPEKKEPIKLDKEGKELLDRLIKLKQDREVQLLRDEYNARSRYEKARDAVLEVINVPRAIMASFDYSAPLRQAVVATVSNPSLAISAGKRMFEASFSQKNFDRWFYELKQNPRYDLMQSTKLSITDPHSPFLTVKEEAYMSNLAEKIPLIGRFVKGSERAYVMYLNKMRADLFDRFADRFEAKGKTYENNKELYDKMADYVNSQTGRGNLGKAEDFAPVLNSLLFSPRLIAARVNLLNPLYFAKLPKELKIAYLKDMGRFVGYGMTAIALSKYASSNDDKNKVTVEEDPRSSDFGKIKSGDIRWDVWGGFQQYVRVISQFATGQRKSTNTKEIQELNGKGPFGTDRVDIVKSFLRGKLAPIPGTTINLLSGRGPFGQPSTISSEAKNLLTPLVLSDAVQAYQDRDIKSLFLVGVPSLFGVGTQTYKSPEKKPKHKAPEKKLKHENPN